MIGGDAGILIHLIIEKQHDGNRIQTQPIRNSYEFGSCPKSSRFQIKI